MTSSISDHAEMDMGIEIDNPYYDHPISDESKYYALFQADQVSSNDMAKRLAPMVKRVCRAVAQKYARRSQEYSAENLTDDLFQEVMLNLITDTKRLYSPTKPLEPLLYQIARRKAGKRYLDTNTVPLDMSNDTDEADHNVFTAENGEYNHDLVDVVDREHAKERIRRVMLKIANEAKKMPTNDAPLRLNDAPYRVDMSLKIDHAPAPLKKEAKRAEKKADGRKPLYVLSTDQVELTNIMDSLAYLQGEFASLLGIQKPTLASYLYGRTAAVPIPVMERARVQLNDKKRLDRIARYHSESMHLIVSEWMTKLGHELDYSKQGLTPLSELLGVHLVSLERWISGTIRPKVNVFLKHDIAVDKAAARK